MTRSRQSGRQAERPNASGRIQPSTYHGRRSRFHRGEMSWRDNPPTGPYAARNGTCELRMRLRALWAVCLFVCLFANAIGRTPSGWNGNRGNTHAVKLSGRVVRNTQHIL